MLKSFSTFTTLLLLVTCLNTNAQNQAGMVNKTSGGQYFNAEQYKIDRLKMEVNETPSSSKKYENPTDFSKPKNGINNYGEIWIDKYCRYRPATTNKAYYCSDMNEQNYLNAIYPADTQIYSDNFSGKGNILWDNIGDKHYKEKTGYTHIADSLNDGITMNFFKDIMYKSDFFRCTEEPAKYQFSRAWKVWVKRVSGPENMPLELVAYYNYTNGRDATVLKISDNGSFEISDLCDNCDHTHHDLDKGKTKAWIKGGWNEICIFKDELNTVKILVNDLIIFQYQIPDIPITTRFATFLINPPHLWQKKNLMYNIGQVSVESYPKMK
ncbi:MAG: hypothetical protein KA198_05660 [Chitinophagaceae bacterium]|nr:hypothetical protein [Chitinophagaceae bacterium]